MERRRDRVRPMLIAIAAFGLLHHADHVLRADHSGWPFQPEVNPFTFSLAIYPMLLADYFVRRRPWLRVGMLGLGLSFLVLVHSTIETPGDLFHTWRTGASTSPVNLGVPNLLDAASPMLGLLSNVVLFLLAGAVAAALVLAVRDAVGSRRIVHSTSLLEGD
jgi:hypothetical protein